MKSKWSVEMLEGVQNQVREEIAKQLQAQDSKDVLRYCLDRVQTFGLNDDAEDDAFRVYYAIAGLVLLAYHPSNAAATVTKLEKIIKALLVRNKVKPRKSLLSHVYGQVSHALSYYYTTQGELFTAIWESAIGFTFSQGSSALNNGEQYLNYAQLLLEKGSAIAASEIFEKLATQSESSRDRQVALLWQAKALRLSGKLEDNRSTLNRLSEIESLDQNLADLYFWEKAASHAIQEGVSALDQYFPKRDWKNHDAHNLIKYSLWMKAQRSLALNDKALKSSWIRKQMMQGKIRDQKLRHSIKVLEVIENCYDTELAFEHRIKEAAQILTINEKLDLETRLLALAALFRWLYRSSQKHLALTVAEEYRSLCYRLSQGKQEDVFGFHEEDMNPAGILADLLDTSAKNGSTTTIFNGILEQVDTQVSVPSKQQSAVTTHAIGKKEAS